MIIIRNPQDSIGNYLGPYSTSSSLAAESKLQPYALKAPPAAPSPRAVSSCAAAAAARSFSTMSVGAFAFEEQFAGAAPGGKSVQRMRETLYRIVLYPILYNIIVTFIL